MNKARLFVCALLLSPFAGESQTTVKANTSKGFKENAFIIRSKKDTIYSDSVGSRISATILNVEKEDKYYLVELIKAHGDRVKVTAKYTIDAAHYSNQTLRGWVRFKSIGVYYKPQRITTPYAFSNCSTKAKKIFFDKEYISEPLAIKRVSFIDGQIWMQVVLGKKNNKTLYGWLSPEMQCVDIWNACAGN